MRHDSPRQRKGEQAYETQRRDAFQSVQDFPVTGNEQIQHELKKGATKQQ